MNQIIQWSKGNPGAMTFLMELVKSEVGIFVFQRLELMPSIRGTNLYVLWSDLCDKDLYKVEKLCIKCPISVLEDACSRQDYSGRKLVAEYLS
jgi:hypothetical protein